MTIDFFQFDWIFIDTVVIILLIVFLVSVRIFKEKVRWRSTLSNVALSRVLLDTQSFKPINQFVKLKKITVTINNVLKRKPMQNPSIVLISSHKYNRLFNVITEGLASYGFDVINIILKKNSSLKHDYIEKELHRESTNLSSSILHSLKQKELITNSNYLLITHRKTLISITPLIYDKNNAGVILINPKFELIAQNHITGITEKKEICSKLFIIFSKKSSKILTGKNLKMLFTYFADNNLLNTNLWRLDKSKGLFKCYETILLGIIINLVESNILKSQILS